MGLFSKHKHLPPQEIHLPAISENWKVEHVSADSKLRILVRPQQELVLLGKLQNKTDPTNLLKFWLKQYGKQRLIPWLQQISEELGLSYSRVTIREQKTRWGSCSSDKAINLNYKLLFFPPELARHVMIHELCHTIHLNHSKHFWQLVEQFEPHWRVLSKQVRLGQHYVPNWVG